ncbi:MAG TPA: tetratricopeptide repeat protein [Gemmataceae bacterium]|nr:tetratricopeptide repeat protein [Gemmataceae bacterium]
MKAIAKLLTAKKWTKAREQIQEELLFNPAEHWLWTTLGATYYGQKEYEKALQCSKRAVELAPNCALVLWDYAGALYMNGQESSALAIWTILLGMDLDEVADGDCSEGMDWALQLINDVHYRMGRYFQHKGEIEQARVSFEKYLHNRQHGVGSIYNVDDVKKHVDKLREAVV